MFSVPYKVWNLLLQWFKSYIIYFFIEGAHCANDWFKFHDNSNDYGIFQGPKPIQGPRPTSVECLLIFLLTYLVPYGLRGTEVYIL